MKPWFIAGSHPQDYGMGIDDSSMYNGKLSAYIKSIREQPGGFGTLMQSFKAEAYRTKRMRFRAVIRSETVENWAALWMRIDGSSRNENLGFDTMKDRPIKGTTGWQTYDIVLDVPQEAMAIAFGILLHGSGQAWLSNVHFEEVDKTVPITATPTAKEFATGPRNLDFSED
jgi:hypothetical protein